MATALAIGTAVLSLPGRTAAAKELLSASGLSKITAGHAIVAAGSTAVLHDDSAVTLHGAQRNARAVSVTNCTDGACGAVANIASTGPDVSPPALHQRNSLVQGTAPDREPTQFAEGAQNHQSTSLSQHSVARVDVEPSNIQITDSAGNVVASLNYGFGFGGAGQTTVSGGGGGVSLSTTLTTTSTKTTTTTVHFLFITIHNSSTKTETTHSDLPLTTVPFPTFSFQASGAFSMCQEASCSVTANEVTASARSTQRAAPLRAEALGAAYEIIGTSHLSATSRQTVQLDGSTQAEVRALQITNAARGSTANAINTAVTDGALQQTNIILQR